MLMGIAKGLAPLPGFGAETKKEKKRVRVVGSHISAKR